MSLEVALSQILKLICIPLVYPRDTKQENTSKPFKTFYPVLFYIKWVWVHPFWLFQPIVWKGAAKLNKYNMSE